MANKVSPKISAPGSMRLPQGGHNPNIGKHGAGLAPKPKGGAPILGNDRPSMPQQAGLARVRGAGRGDAGMRLPLASPAANVSGTRVGQPNPDTGAAASTKPKRRGLGAAFYGEY